MPDPRDIELRNTALEHVRELQRRYNDLVPVPALAQGFQFRGRRVSLGSFYSGIFRPKELNGPAALCLVTAPPKSGRPAPYDDEFDEATDRFTYRFRAARTQTPAARLQAAADNRALVAAHELAVPLIYFRGIASGQYAVVAPTFVIAVDERDELVELQAGLPIADTTPAGLVSGEDVRRYATREALVRLHQHRFRAAVLRAYTTRCAVCRLREATLLQAAHIIDDRDPGGVATVVNGISLCAIHHLAYDRNLLGIDPGGVVTSHDACSTRSTARCSAVGCRSSTAPRSFNHVDVTNTRTPTACSCATSSSWRSREPRARSQLRPVMTGVGRVR